MGYYHSEFASASRQSSQIYLDGVFVDMMWYKAFSVWLLLKLQHNVLFQDIDIVWFKDPFPYFHNFIARAQREHLLTPDAFLSDDGQRSTVRYSPFYANSGFYYFLSSEKTLQLAWSIMLTFDVMQSSGSHQNTFTQRLQEAVDLGRLHTQSIHQDDFTNGATYHHRPGYMKLIREQKVLPYMFHMCWTANKTQKLQFFRRAKMWYLKEKFPASDFMPNGYMSTLLNKRSVNRKEIASPEERWQFVSQRVCDVMDGAPEGTLVGAS